MSHSSQTSRFLVRLYQTQAQRWSRLACLDRAFSFFFRCVKRPALPIITPHTPSSTTFLAAQKKLCIRSCSLSSIDGDISLVSTSADESATSPCSSPQARSPRRLLRLYHFRSLDKDGSLSHSEDRENEAVDAVHVQSMLNNDISPFLLTCSMSTVNNTLPIEEKIMAQRKRKREIIKIVS